MKNDVLNMYTKWCSFSLIIEEEKKSLKVQQVKTKICKINCLSDKERHFTTHHYQAILQTLNYSIPKRLSYI